MPSEELTYRAGVEEKLKGLDEKTDEILRQVRYTNGKVRKIIIALVLVCGVLIGQTFSNSHDIIQLLASFL